MQGARLPQGVLLSQGEVQALFLRHEGYLGAIGAFLKGAEQDSEWRVAVGRGLGPCQGGVGACAARGGGRSEAAGNDTERARPPRLSRPHWAAVAEWDVVGFGGPPPQ